MRLTRLLEAAGITPVSIRGEAEVRSVASDSRRGGAGCCFVAVKGPNDDGHRHIASALSAGSCAVVCQDASSVPAGVACAVVEDTQQAAGRLAQAIHGWPGRKLTAVGVTGTKGKSTVTYLIRAILAAAGHDVALLGTISYETGKASRPAGNTTPGAVELADLAAEMVEAGKTHLVMEVSSHALHQRRTEGVDFRVGVFTNLTGEHLDYHKTMEEYLLAKQILFEQLSPQATAVINRDDGAGEQLARATPAKVCWYGLNSTADFQARIGRIDAAGTRFVLSAGGRELNVAIPLIGRHNVYNCLAAAGACSALGVPLETIVSALESVDRVPGRMERVPVDAPYTAFVDYAHTDDALDKALSAVRPLAKGRLIVVFGCGGDRDRTKRPRMAAVAARLADCVVVTSDNPRSERPEAIIDEILAGLDAAGTAKTTVEPDRRKAIEIAISQAGEGDVVVIAGKGHETYQIIGETRAHFDDAEEAARCMRTKEAAK
ncbi:MAG: UDP-N-acetylmuramoyl-L-alanyl-D-glutamate--2,6-diaminopimelate ligase [Phycisphaerae bacterium]|jgi:UDP-N-acetylmuramoyl-L-alanyl-D-glutamate--2,6-diaminopimelate ligase